MLMLPPSVKIYLAVEPIDMRKGMDALSNVVRNALREEPMSGHLFVFRGRQGHMLRILFWDRTGWALYAKRLEKGKFYLPATVPENAQRVEIEAAQLALMLEGIDLAGATRHTRWRPPRAEDALKSLTSV